MNEPSRRELLLASGSTFLLGAAGCLAPHSDQVDDGPTTVDAVDTWPMFLYDTDNRRCFRGESVSIQDSPTWSTPTDDSIWSSPVVADGLLYIGSYDGHLYAVDVDTGEVAWRYQTGDRIDGTPAVADGLVYVGSFDRNLYALDADTGDERWIHGTEGIIRSSPTVADGTVYVGSHCRSEECAVYYDVEWPEIGYVYAFDAYLGDAKWRVEVGDGILGKPVVSDGMVVVGSSDGTVYAIDEKTGTIEWEHDTESPIMASPTCAGDRIYYGNLTGDVFARSIETTELLWHQSIDEQTSDGVLTPSLITSSPTVCGETVIFGTAVTDVAEGSYGQLVGLAAEDGHEHWRAGPFAEMIGSSPVIVDGVVYFGAHTLGPSDEYEPGIFGVTMDGINTWEFTVDGTEHRGFGSSPAIADDRLFIGGADGSIHAFELSE